MSSSFQPVDQHWWFKLGVIALAIIVTTLLFHAGGIDVYADGVLSARTLLFFFSWFGLERAMTGLVWAALAYLRPESVEPD